MRFHIYPLRVLYTVVIVCLNFIVTIFGMRKISPNLSSTAFVHNLPDSKLRNLNNIRSIPQQLIKNNTAKDIENTHRVRKNPFNQSPTDILSDIFGPDSEFSLKLQNKNLSRKASTISGAAKRSTTLEVTAVSPQINKTQAGGTKEGFSESEKVGSTIQKTQAGDLKEGYTAPDTAYKKDRIKMTIEYECEPTEYINAVPSDSAKLENFDKIWNGIASVRKNQNAPVDSMGAHCLGDKKADIETQRFQYLVACLLSSQTKDNVTAEAVRNLKDSGLLSVDDILNSTFEKIDKCIGKVGFHNTKAKNLMKVCSILKEKYDRKVPGNLNELTELPGIGPKMAYLILQLGFNKVEGIAVDVHVHRIANRLGWVKTKTPEDTRRELEKIVPQKFWAQLNVLLVGFGQTICTKAGPSCSTCPVNSYCPVGRAVLR